MAYQYSNPYRRADYPQSAPAARDSYRLLFTGLPPAVTQDNLLDVLVSEPLFIPRDYITVIAVHALDGKSMGYAIVNVETERHAESIRKQYNGLRIDDIHHILPSTTPFPFPPPVARPAPAPVPVAPRAAPVAAPIQPARQIPTYPGYRGPLPARPVAAVPVQQQNGGKGKGKAGGAGQPEGLALLARIGKPGAKNTKQTQLLDKQRANLSKTSVPANQKSLLSRLQPAKSAAKGKAQANGAAKVGRAKVKAAKKDAMDVDEPIVQAGQTGAKKGKKGQEHKTPEELDAELAAYERQKKFVAA
ncbi:hypothetical protein IAT38_002816 [Cryptococcus sp. DSM 104549]